MAFQYVIVKNSGRGRGYLPTIMPEATEISDYTGGSARPGRARSGGWYLVLYHNKDDGGYGY